MVHNGKSENQMDDLGVPQFEETSIYSERLLFRILPRIKIYLFRFSLNKWVVDLDYIVKTMLLIRPHQPHYIVVILWFVRYFPSTPSPIEDGRILPGDGEQLMHMTAEITCFTNVFLRDCIRLRWSLVSLVLFFSFWLTLLPLGSRWDQANCSIHSETLHLLRSSM